MYLGVANSKTPVYTQTDLTIGTQKFDSCSFVLCSVHITL